MTEPCGRRINWWWDWCLDAKRKTSEREKKRVETQTHSETGAGCFHTLSNILAKNEVLLLALGGSGGVEDVA